MPAGSLERLKVAVLYGADAVYLGTPDMSLRTKSKFTLEEVKEGIAFAHEHGVRVYLTLNLFTHNKDIPKLEDYIKTLRDVMPDGVIIADPGVFTYVQEHAPELKLHVSTQANVCSWATVKFWEKQGADLIVLAREVTFKELAEIRQKCPDVRLESFIHGAMCMTYSGRCLLSNFMAERGANQGNCANSCRWQYKVKLKLKDGSIEELPLTEENMKMFDFVLEEGHRPGDFMPIIEDERGSYILNSKDMCLMPVLDDYLKIGIDSLKIEGRNKSPYYIAVVAGAYRRAIDDYYALEDKSQWNYKPYMRELETVANRGFTLAFHEGRLCNYAHNYENTKTMAAWEYAGIIREVRDDCFIVEPKNHLMAGDVLEFLSPITRTATLLRVYEYEIDGDEENQSEVHGGPRKRIRIPFSLFDHESDLEALKTNHPPYTIIRKEAALTEEEWQRLKLDRLAQKIELGQGSESQYPQRVHLLQKTIGEELMERRSKTSRSGIEGCCGRGCNGCAVFWNDPIYAKARERLAQKKHGEMLERDGKKT
jgi:putative protease